jgi:hypothetical protein
MSMSVFLDPSMIWPSIQLPNIDALVVPPQWAASLLETFYMEWVPRVMLKTLPLLFI